MSASHHPHPHPRPGDLDREPGPAGAHAGGHDHGSYRSYATGFGLSVILTAIPFWLVMGEVLEGRGLTIALVLACALAQVLVHMVYFLHLNTRSDEGWNFVATIFTIIVVVIMMAGSLWVMHNMNANMMPQMDHEAVTGFGS
ncbi:cytochrome o ubiquinol oxidase subunit IV [Frigidibacter oleivorans]|uniref:cytochrome o ubiquinol oxidase subunit IV n=1 Tax=Frigidibacter oleivorans TaxID=2487129 RepID=UPI000F8E5F67|nr:cytochrome o ubiquinol oxidase subunit IV [Frigidibacter oleivorans]